VNRNYIFSNVNEALPVLMGDLLEADEVGSRAGRTHEMTHVGITLTQPWQREIVLPDRKASVAAQIVETMWVLSGRNDVEGLLPYLPRAADYSDDGKTWRSGYGPRLRDFYGVDQLAYVVDTLRASPGSRQAVAAIWDPQVDTRPGKDIACNGWLSFSSRLGKLDFHIAIRSNDAMWGWSGINAFEWSALQEVIAGLLALQVGSLHFSVTSFHLYDIHWAKARRIAEQGGSFLYDDSPRFNRLACTTVAGFDDLASQWFELEEQIRLGRPVDVEAFPEPMLRSWLRVLQWYWSGDESFLAGLLHTRLAQACHVGVKPPDFRSYVNALHAEKHAAYGDSWKRRGEPGILANIARKIDRLESGVDTSDETQRDTAIDLLVYLCKYRCWLADQDGDPADVAVVLGELTGTDRPLRLVGDFAELESLTYWAEKMQLVNIMLEQAFTLARRK